MKNRITSLNIIFTLLFLIMSALFLIYIFRDIQNKECFEGPSYSWKYGEGHTCGGFLNTSSELRKSQSDYNTKGFNRFHDNTLYTKENLRNASHPYRNYCDIMNYNDLLAYKCLNKSPIEMRTTFENVLNVASTIDYIYIYDEKSLYSYILTKITNQKDRNLNGNKIIGPVYVCISQAPFLKYKSDYTKHTSFDKTLDARIDILNNRNPYYFEQINNLGVQSFRTNTVDNEETDASDYVMSSLYSHVLIVYPLYNKNMTLKETDKAKQASLITKFLDEKPMKDFYTNNELCFIKCNKATTLTCGCLSRTSNSSSQSPAAAATAGSLTENNKRDKPAYSSKCIDHTKNNTEGNFSMMYYVNPYSDSYGDGNIIEDPAEIQQLPGVSQKESEEIYRMENTCSFI